MKQLIEKPIHNEQAERAFLETVLNNASDKYVSEILELISPDEFGNLSNKLIFKALTVLVGNGTSLDTINVIEELKREGTLEKVGGASYIVELSSNPYRFKEQAAEFAKAVKEAHAKSQILKVAGELASLAQAQDINSEDAINRAGSIFFELTNTKRQNVVDAATMVKDFLKDSEKKVEPIPTGISGLDAILGGMYPQQLLIIGARPAVGKSALALCIANNVARRGDGVLFFSLEMSSELITNRLLSQESRLPTRKLLRIEQFNSDEYLELATAVETISQRKFYFNDDSSLTTGDLALIARKYVSKHNVKLIVIDYLQLLNTTKTHKDIYHEVSQISKFLKQLAMSLNVPVLALSQLSRASEKRVDRRPVLSDLRESGSIEQDADVIMFPFFEDTERNFANNTVPYELIISKHRMGPLGKVHLNFIKDICLFEQRY